MRRSSGRWIARFQRRGWILHVGQKKIVFAKSPSMSSWGQWKREATIEVHKTWKCTNFGSWFCFDPLVYRGRYVGRGFDGMHSTDDSTKWAGIFVSHTLSSTRPLPTREPFTAPLTATATTALPVGKLCWCPSFWRAGQRRRKTTA